MPGINIIIGFITCNCFICSCANLKEVNSFAVVSHQLMEANKFIDYGYYQFARDSAVIYNPMPAHLRDVDCNCEPIKQADTILAKECQVLSAYFTTLAVFTDPKSAIAVDPLGKAVSAGSYGQLTIGDREAGIVAGLASALSDGFTTGYKAKKLARFVYIYKDSVAPLIGYLRLHGNNLAGKIENLQLELTRVADSLLDKANSKEARWSILFTYRQKMTSLDEILSRYARREADFKGLLVAGQLVYDNQHNLQSNGFKKKLMILVSDLSQNANF